MTEPKSNELPPPTAQDTPPTRRTVLGTAMFGGALAAITSALLAPRSWRRRATASPKPTKPLRRSKLPWIGH